MHDIMLFMGTVIMGFFAIMNPVANTPIFMGLTSTIDDRKTKNAIAFRSVLFAFGMVSVFVILGNIIFRVFGITLPAFQITGGILLFVIGYDMLQGQVSKLHHHSKEAHEEIKAKASNPDTALSLALTPLGIPILAGPGTIATAMNFAGMNSGMGHVGQVIAIIISFAVMCIITFLMFISANRIIGFLGKHVINVISRVMGLILALIATQMVILGIKNAIEMYSKSA